MVSVNPTDTLKGFAITRFLADVDNTAPRMPNNPLGVYEIETLAKCMNHLSRLTAIFRDKLDSHIEEAGGITRASLVAADTYRLLTQTADNYVKNNRLENDSTIMGFLPICLGSIAAAFAAEHVAQSGEAAKRAYIENEVKDHLRDVKIDSANLGIDYAEGLGINYLQLATEVAARKNHMPTVYNEVADAFMEADLKELRALKGSHINVELFLRKTAEEAGYPLPQTFRNIN